MHKGISMETIHIKLTRFEVELLHRVFSARILAAPPGVEDGLRKKMARAKKVLKEQLAETVDHGGQHDDSSGVSESTVSSDEGRRNDRTQSATAGQLVEQADPNVDQAGV